MATALSLAWVMAMGSPIRISYRWRLFIPLVLLLLMIIAVLVVFQYRREMSYRAESLNNQLDLASTRLVYVYERNYDLAPYVRFLQQYYVDAPVSVSVFDKAGNRAFCVGTPIYQRLPNGEQTPEFKMLEEQGGVGKSLRNSPYRDKGLYLYSVRKSKDGEIYVHTALPYTISVFEALSSQPSVWIVVLVLSIIAVLIAFYGTRYFGRNVEALRDFANCEDNEERKKFAVEKFKSDELGDIGRQIVKLYRDKEEAIELGQRKHEVAMRALKEKSQLKREMTNNINHELKTPIGIIKGYLDTIVEDESMSPETMREFVVKTRPHVVRLNNLLADVSAITRLEEAPDSIPMTTLDFKNLLHSVADDLSVTSVGENFKFVNDVPTHCQVVGNMTLLGSVMLNLAKNAAIYSHGTEMGVKCVGETASHYAFVFYDNGVGVGEEHLEQLFDRFYRVDTGRSRKVGGTGLGLSIVKSGIQAMNGTIEVRNRAKGGLEFEFTLSKAMK